MKKDVLITIKGIQKTHGEKQVVSYERQVYGGSIGVEVVGHVRHRRRVHIQRQWRNQTSNNQQHQQADHAQARLRRNKPAIQLFQNYLQNFEMAQCGIIEINNVSQ